MYANGSISFDAALTAQPQSFIINLITDLSNKQDKNTSAYINTTNTSILLNTTVYGTGNITVTKNTNGSLTFDASLLAQPQSFISNLITDLSNKVNTNTSAYINSTNTSVILTSNLNATFDHNASNLTFPSSSSSPAMQCGSSCHGAVNYTLLNSSVNPQNMNASNISSGTLGITNGGTGQTTQAAAFDALDPLTTKGDILVNNGTNATRLPIGTDGQVLVANSSATNGLNWQSKIAPVMLVNITQTCSRNTAANAMTGLNVNYTTSVNSTGAIYLSLNFQVSATGNNINSKYQLAYGTGAAPLCNAAAAGTTKGNQYNISTIANPAGAIVQPFSETVAISGLSPNTKYWFDLQATDSTVAVWTYSLPQLSVIEP